MSRMPRIGWALSCAVMLSAMILLGVGQARAESFEPVVRVTRRSYALLAVHIGRTRLIDNMLIEPVGEELVATL